MSLAINLKEARTKKGLTQGELANLLGKTKNVISNWERGDNKPDADTLFELCDILDVDANYLLGWESNQNLSLSLKEQDYIKKYRILDEHGKDLTDYVLNAEYDRCVKEPEVTYETVLKPDFQACLSAGTGQFVFDDLPCEQIEVPIEYSDIDFVIGVSGDSMEPTYHDGDKVMIKKGEVAIGQVGAFMINGVALLKELGKDRLISHNKEYDDLLFDEFMRIDCVGKVVGILEKSI